MKFKTPVTLNVLSPLPRYSREEFLDAVLMYCDMLPMMLPEKWGWWEPLNRVFDFKNLEELIPENNVCSTLDWKRTKRPKAEGSFRVRWHSNSIAVRDTHAVTDVTSELGQVDQGALVAWLKKASLGGSADFAMIDALTPGYREFAIESNSAQFGERFMLTTHVLRHWLPDVFWGTVFGPAYVKLFGKEQLLSAPAYIVEPIGDDMVYMQLTENLTDVAKDTASIQLVRNAVKKHLAIDAFFESGRGYDRLQCGPVGNVFVVPEFKLQPYNLI